MSRNARNPAPRAIRLTSATVKPRALFLAALLLALLPLHLAAAGTKGGPRTNTKGQVLHVRGDIIPGLYAAGNAMAGVSGPGYYGGGGTIGLAMTWGYICGINAAQEAKIAGAAQIAAGS